ncbi:MAG: hypothetical protein IPM24_17900 [Bryobacterales bacterium]|nr:hypothetical protein [Bryobacterales bacterium]
MPKIRGFKFELYEDAGPNGLESFVPQKFVQPGDDVAIIEGADTAYHRLPYVFVEVLSGLARDAFGFLPKDALTEAEVVQTSVGLRDVTLTGTTYGAYTDVANPGRHGSRRERERIDLVIGSKNLRFEQCFSGSETCEHCGNTADRHRIYESMDTKQAALAIHGAMRTLGVGGQFMFGVLEVQGNRVRRYGAPSSSLYSNKANFKQFETACGQLGINPVDPGDPAGWDNLLDCRGKAIDLVGKEKISIRNMKTEFLVCAAPKLIQRAIQVWQANAFQGTMFMTEVWYQQSNTNANYADAHTTESCAKCRVMVPRMLCGYKGKV